MCFDKRVLIGLGVVALGVLAVSPDLLRTIGPMLLFAACPISMLFMMRGMSGTASSCDTKTGSEQSAQAATTLGSAPASEGDRELRALRDEVQRLRAEVRAGDSERSA